LAGELTRLVHGPEGLAAAERATAVFFGGEIGDLSDAQLGEIFADVPSKQIDRTLLADPGLGVVDALAEAGLANTKGDARRVVTQGGAYVNNRRIAGIETRLGTGDLVGGSMIVLRTGKKNYALLRFLEG
jgi:tyrosyl-tRNA synthetase